MFVRGCDSRNVDPESEGGCMLRTDELGDGIGAGRFPILGAMGLFVWWNLGVSDHVLCKGMDTRELDEETVISMTLIVGLCGRELGGLCGVK
jgi:hypothetical protein